MNMNEEYVNNIKNRSELRYFLGLLIRLGKYVKFAFLRKVARKKGAIIGNNTNITWNIAYRANKNLIIGEDCVIEAKHFDLRGGKIIIHNHVVINKEVSIIRVSHHIDNDDSFASKYYSDLHIKSYSWLATGAKILPQVTCIDEGSVVGAYSVVVKNCAPDGVYAGNPAILVRTHNTRFTNICLCSLQGGDLKYYIKARKL